MVYGEAIKFGGDPMSWGMMGGNYDSGSWIWMTLVTVLLVAGVIALGVWAVRATTRHAPDSSDSAIDVLRGRLASGEITQDDFDKTRKALRG